MHVRDARLSVIGHRRAQLRPGGPDNHVAAQGVGQLRCQAHAGALACQGAFINKYWLASRSDAPCTLASWAPHNSSRAAATTSSEWGASVASVGERAGVLEAATCGIATLEGVVAQRRRRVRRPRAAVLQITKNTVAVLQKVELHALLLGQLVPARFADLERPRVRHSTINGAGWKEAASDSCLRAPHP